MNYFDSDMSKSTNTVSHTIYSAKFEQTIIHQQVHLRQENQSHEPAHCSFVYNAKEGRYVRISNYIRLRSLIRTSPKISCTWLYSSAYTLLIFTIRDLNRNCT